MLDRNRMLRQGDPERDYQASLDVYRDGHHNYAHYGQYDLHDQDEAFNPLKLLFYIIQYRWLIMLLLAIGLAAGFMFTMMQTPKYEATAQLEVLVPSAKVFQDIEVMSEVTDVRSFLTAREKLKSRALAQRVVYELGLTEKPDFLFPKPDFSLLNMFYRAFGVSNTTNLDDYPPEERERLAISRVINGLSVDLVTNTSLLSVKFRDQQPSYAQEVANQIAQSFIDQRVDQTSETSDLARQFIQEQVVQVKEKLQASEKALVEYAKIAGITVTGDEKSLISSSLASINTALAAAVQESLDYGRLVQQIEAGRGESLEQVLQSEGLDKLRGKIAELNADYQQKLSFFKPDFPEMLQLKSQIREMDSQLEKGVIVITESIKLKYQETLGKVSDLRAKLAELEAQQAEYQDKNIQYTILKREVESNRSQYDTLIGKLNEVGVSADLKTQNAAIVDLAVAPRVPYSPRLTVNLAIAMALFMALGAAIIYVIELLNNTFTNPEQVEKELGLAVLGMIPLIEAKDIGQSMSDSRSAVSEAYRSLRTSLQFSGSEGAPRTLLVTSSEPAEGKSTTVYKLAQDFASLNAKVLVIDADLRKPSIHRLFGLDNTLGLSNLLTNTLNREDFSRLIRPTKYDNVSVVTCGTIPPNPADLLSSPRMAAAISSFAKRFDLVIVDAPPVVGLSDAPILSRLTESALLVVSTNQVTRKSAKNALKRLRSAGANVVGAALSKFSTNRLDYKYAYNYMNYEYYAYGSENQRLPGSVDGGGALSDGTATETDNLVRRVRGSLRTWLSRIKPDT
ncbi:GumC family protein [Mesorhizobium sp. 10J20-29]